MRKPLVIVAAVVVVVAAVGGWFAYDHLVGTEADEAFALPTTTAGDQDAPTTEPSDAPVVAGEWAATAASQAGYRIVEDSVAGEVTVTGRTNGVTGTVELTESALTGTEVVVDMASVASDQALRDKAFRETIMSTDQFPTATFTQTAEVALDAVPAIGAPLTVEVPGTLTMKGVTVPVTAKVDAVRSASDLTVVGTVDVTLQDFGIEPPSIANFVTVRPAGTVEFKLVLERP